VCRVCDLGFGISAFGVAQSDNYLFRISDLVFRQLFVSYPQASFDAFFNPVYYEFTVAKKYFQNLADQINALNKQKIEIRSKVLSSYCGNTADRRNLRTVLAQKENLSSWLQRFGNASN